MKKAALVLLLSAACFCAFAENTDSLKAEIERLKAKLEIQRLTAELEKIERERAARAQQNLRTGEQVSHLESAGEIDTNAQSEPQKRTVGERIDAAMEKFRNAFSSDRDDEKTHAPAAQTPQADTVSDFRKIVLESRQWRRNAFVGLGGGPSMGIMHLDVKPVRNYLRALEDISGSPLAGTGFHTAVGRREVAFLSGGFGYGNLGNGTIIGGGGHAIFASVGHRTGNARLLAEISGGYGGFIFGGSWKKDKNALSVTTLVGGGGLEVDVGKSGRISWDFDDDDDILTDDNATFFAIEPQLAYTRSILRWFHVGVEAGGLLMHSQRGFGWTDGFTSFNPTAKLKFTFGSI